MCCLESIFFGYGLESKSLAINKITKLVINALSDYYCLLPASYNVTLSPNSSIIVDANECVFVPKKVRESTDCGGLNSYKTIRKSVLDQNFCSREFGKN